MNSLGYNLAADLASIGDALRRVTVEVSVSGASHASGVVWRDDGLIVTNAHVAQANRLAIRLWDGREGNAVLVARSGRFDLAILRGPWPSLPAAMLGDARHLRVGDLVFAYGAPLGIPQAITAGIVHRTPLTRRGNSAIEADLRLAPGNSGGPMADASAGVVGINTAVVRGVGMAIPSHVVSRFVRRVESRAVAA